MFVGEEVRVGVFEREEVISGGREVRKALRQFIVRGTWVVLGCEFFFFLRWDG